MIRKTGDWDRALATLTHLSGQAAQALKQAVAQEAHGLRKGIVEGLTEQAPGGAPFQPIADLTRASRRLKRFGGTKALMVRGDLRNSIAVVVKGDVAFVGVLRRARATDGSHLIDLAEVHEFGTGPVVIPMTPAMRRYLAVLLREAGVARDPRHTSKAYIVRVTPPRPFLRPAARAWLKGLRARFARRLADTLDGSNA